MLPDLEDGPGGALLPHGLREVAVDLRREAVNEAVQDQLIINRTPEGDILSQLEIPRVQPGSKVAVSYDPANPAKIAIDLNAPVNVQAFCNYCQKTFPAGSANCPYCGAAAS